MMDFDEAKKELTVNGLSLIDKGWSLFVKDGIKTEAQDYLKVNAPELFRVKNQQEFNSGYTDGERRISDYSSEEYAALQDFVKSNTSHIELPKNQTILDLVTHDLKEQTKNIPSDTLKTLSTFGAYIEDDRFTTHFVDGVDMMAEMPSAMWDSFVGSAKSTYDAFSTIDPIVSDRLDGLYGEGGAASQVSISKMDATLGALGLIGGAAVVKSGVKGLEKGDVDSVDNQLSFVVKNNEIEQARIVAESTNYIDDAGRLIYPDNKKQLDVVPGSIEKTTLKKGDVIVRYIYKDTLNKKHVDVRGNIKYEPTNDTGSYSTIKGESWESLSLPGKKSDYKAYELEIVEDIEVTKSITTKWFENGIGGGVQMQFDKGLYELAKTTSTHKPKIKLKENK